MILCEFLLISAHLADHAPDIKVPEQPCSAPVVVGELRDLRCWCRITPAFSQFPIYHRGEMTRKAALLLVIIMALSKPCGHGFRHQTLASDLDEGLRGCARV
jgi:hypothetical protein